MRRLLVIANLHHASPRIPAVLAPLKDFGWEATVVTVPLGTGAVETLALPARFVESVKIVEAQFPGDVFRLWRRLLLRRGFSPGASLTEQIKDRIGGGSRRGMVDNAMALYQALFAIPDTERSWIRPACRTAAVVLRGKRHHALLSSSPYPTSHFVASRLTTRFGIPWIADFRDPWSQSHNYSMPRWRQAIDRRIEASIVRSARAITTVSMGFAEKLRAIHGDRVEIIRNGYQPSKCEAADPPTDRFTISYTGTIYAGKQDPVKLLRAVRTLIDDGTIDPARIGVDFYGRHDSSLQGEIVHLRLEAVAMQHGTLARAEIRRRQQRSHLLLLLQWEDLKERGIFPLKFYEYLDAGRPILATGGGRDSEIADILRHTRAGQIAVDAGEITDRLASAYQMFITTGGVEYQGDRHAIEEYSYAGSARKLARCLDRLAPGGEGRRS